MYLRSQSLPDQSLLQFTGQLTFMAHPIHLQHLQHQPQYHPYMMAAHCQAVQQPLPAQYLQEPQQYPPLQANYLPPQYSRAKTPQEQGLERGEHAGEKERAREERLEGTEQVGMLANISKINC